MREGKLLSCNLVFTHGKADARFILLRHFLEDLGQLFPESKEISVFALSTRWHNFADLCEFSLIATIQDETLIGLDCISFILKIAVARVLC